MKRGDKVWVCQDGKFSRRVEGVVVQNHHGNRIKVRFVYGQCEEDTEEVEAWFGRNTTIRYSRTRDGSCFSYGKRYKRFAGWVVNKGWWCPWFRIVKMKKGEENA